MSIDFNSPTTLIEGRMNALNQGDYALIHDSYHDEAPFLNHFSGKAEYLAFADQQLKQMELTQWKILRQREDENGDVEILLWMRVGTGDSVRDLYELSLLIDTADGWRYHSAQKLTGEEYSGPVEEIGFENFDQASPKIRF